MYDFDGHIKKRAGEYGLEPRKQVWDRIEQELDAKKTKRRAVWFWWLLPISLLGGGMATYQFLQHDTAQEATFVSKKQSINTTSQKDMQANPSTVNLSPTTPIATESLPVQAPLQHFEKQATGPNKIAIENKNLTSKKGFDGYSAEKNTNSTNRVASSEKNGQTQIKTESDNSFAEKQGMLMDTLPGKTALQSGLADPYAAEKIVSAEAAVTVAISDTAMQISSSKSPSGSAPDSGIIVPAVNTIKKPSKATWTVLMGAGLHNLTGAGLSLEKSMADYLYSNPLNNSGGNLGNASGQLVPTQPGPGFMLGVERSQAFGQSKRWSWMAGLHYQFQTMQITTGERKDSSITVRTDGGSETKSANYYYRGGSSIEHTGSQHRAHIVAAVQWYMGKKQKWSWQNGFYGGIVLANDYLLPQSSATGWVPSKGLVNTGYFGMETGIKFQPGKIGGGLYGQYNFTSTVNASNLPKQFWRGVELRINYKLPSSSAKK